MRSRANRGYAFRKRIRWKPIRGWNGAKTFRPRMGKRLAPVQSSPSVSAMPTVQDITLREPAGRAAEAAASGELRDLEGEKMVLNMGPSHPSTHGVLRIVLEMDGE